MTVSRELAEFATGYGAGSFAVGRNRIINGDMRIDQRNAGAAVTITTGSLVYCVDRFYNFALGANATAQRVSSGVSEFPFAVRITGASGNTYFETGQRIESANCADLVGKQVTVSFTVASSSLSTISCTLVRASGGVDNFGSTTEIQTISQPITSTLTQYSVTFNALPSTAADGIAIGFIASSGLAASETITITGVQLEAGTVATPFERRSYGQELALCQRYYSAQNFSLNQWVNSSTGCRSMLYVPVPLRTTGTFALSNETKSGVSTTFVETSYSYGASVYWLGTTGGAAGGWSGTLTATAEL